MYSETGVQPEPLRSPEIDQKKVLELQNKLIMSMGFQNDDQVIEFIVNYAAEYRKLVNQDEEVKGLLRKNSTNNEDEFLRVVKIKLGLVN